MYRAAGFITENRTILAMYLRSAGGVCFTQQKLFLRTDKFAYNSLTFVDE